MSKITDEQLGIIHQHNKRLAKSLGRDLQFANPDMIAENMKTAKDILEAQWTKVEDGLPEEKGIFNIEDHEYVLLWVRVTTEAGNEYYMAARYYGDNTWGGLLTPSDDVTHYQPIVPPGEA